MLNELLEYKQNLCDKKMTSKTKTSKKNYTIFDQKCITCGTWMNTTENNKDDTVITYFCSECGLSYSAVVENSESQSK